MGVTSSRSTSTPWIGAPLSSSSVAGAGSGRLPCAAFTNPRPIGSGEQITRSTCSDSSASATPTISPMASIAPTSWKCTRSGGMSWIRPSAIASRLNASCARCSARSGRPAAAISCLIVPQSRCGCSAAPVIVVVTAVIPCRSAVPRSISRSKADRSTVAPGVEQRAEQHVPGDPADAVHVQDHFADCLAILAAIVPAPNPSSMFTTATPAAQLVIIASSALTPPNVAP